MAKGGARVNSGPPPDPNALRRERDAGEWVELPEAGRDGEPLVWPLSEASRRELELWDAEWRRPQAIMWERNGQALEVALYVRAVVDAEMPRAPVSARTLVRQQMDSLGLTTPGMLRNRWKIVREVQPAVSARTSSSARPSARDRLKVVNGGA